MPLDAVFLNVTPPDAHGFCSLGTSVDASLAASRAAKRMIVQLNRSMPRTHGDTFIHVSRIDLAVEVDVPPYSHVEQPLGDVERRIGQHIAELVPDGATLQLGIGAIPSATAMALRDKKDLGVHTEMFTEPVVDLVECGAVTGIRKEINSGKIVSAFLMGTQRLYDFVDDNPMIELRPVDYTNDTAVIRRFRRMVAVNSAIQVDVTGQVVADSIGKRFYSGVGGQMDFIRGRGAGRGGPGDHRDCPPRRQAAPSRASSRCSTPVPGVVTTRAHVQTIVTEYGVAAAPRPEHRRAGQGADRDCAPGLPRGAAAPGAPGPPALTTVPMRSAWSVLRSPRYGAGHPRTVARCADAGCLQQALHPARVGRGTAPAARACARHRRAARRRAPRRPGWAGGSHPRSPHPDPRTPRAAVSARVHGPMPGTAARRRATSAGSPCQSRRKPRGTHHDLGASPLQAELMEGEVAQAGQDRWLRREPEPAPVRAPARRNVANDCPKGSAAPRDR